MERIDHILVVDDDRDIRELIVDYLEKSGYRASGAANGKAMWSVLKNHQIDLIVLDIMMPGEDGLTLCRQLRANPQQDIPVLMLTARTDDSDRILGLEMGADDYLPKPFSVLELIARVKALFRRQEAMGQNLRLEAGIIRCHGMEIDPLAREVRLRGETIDLTPREFDLLYWFARHPGEVFSRLSLLDHVWGYQHEGYEHTVNTHINRLRVKIEKDAAEPDIILTVWGKGYKFAVEKAEPHA